jgi:hypothetical protein
MHSGNLLEQATESILEITEAAKSTAGVIDSNHIEFKHFLSTINDIFHHELLEIKPDENDAIIFNFLKQYLGHSGNMYINQFVVAYSQDQSKRQIIVACIVLLLYERKLSDLFLFLLPNNDLKKFYKPSASLLNIEIMIKLIKRIQDFESKKIVIKARWIDKYQEGKPVEISKTKEAMFELLANSSSTFQYPQSTTLYKSLTEDDPIKKWMQEKSSFNIDHLEKRLKYDLDTSNNREELPRFGERVSNARNSKIIDRPTIVFPNTNKLYKVLMDLNHSEKKKDISLEESRETLPKDIESNSYSVYSTFIEPHIGKFNDLIYKKEKMTPKTAPREFCPACRTNLRFGFFGVE